MAKIKKLDLGLTALDELFMTDEQRTEARLPRVYEIPIAEIDEFPDHPFRIGSDEDMELLKDSLKEAGIITPAVIRRKEDGRYEMISGHRRMNAAKALGYETLPCEIIDVTHDQATVLMVDSNLQRSKIGPCEKGRALKMKSEALNHQGMRTDLTSAPNGTKLPCPDGTRFSAPNGTKFNTGDVLAKEFSSSHTNVYRYIALTRLLPDLQSAVDGGLMSITAGVEISKLDEESQWSVLECAIERSHYPSPHEATEIRKAYENGSGVSKERVYGINSDKPRKLHIDWSKIFALLPDSMSYEKKCDHIEKALIWYKGELERKARSREDAR